MKAGRRRLIDGSAEVNYEYESESPPLYVSTSISLEKDNRDAITTYTSQSVGGSVGLSIAGDGLKMEERQDLLAFGDQSKSQLLTMNGKPVGNFFITRKGPRVLMVIFSGVYFDDPEALRSVMEPKLEAFQLLER